MFDTDGSIINTAIQSGHIHRLLINPEEKKHYFHVIMIDQYTITRSEWPHYYFIIASQPTSEHLFCFATK